MTTPVLFSRIMNIDNTSYLVVFLAIIALIIWYFLHYLFVWNYCKKRGHAKWTWTLLVMFGPNLLFIPVYMFYAVYVFRPYFFRFIKTVVEEYKAYNPKVPFKEESDTEVLEVEKKEKTIKKVEPKKEKAREVEPKKVEDKEK